MVAEPPALMADMCDVNASALAGVDVLVAGTPCQSFSVLGSRNSLADESGNLALEYARLWRESGTTICIWENVPGVFSTKDNAFGAMLAELGAIPPPPVPRAPGWPRAGVARSGDVSLAWRVLDAQHFGVAQRRKRVFLAASKDPAVCPASVLFESLPSTLFGSLSWADHLSLVPPDHWTSSGDFALWHVGESVGVDAGEAPARPVRVNRSAVLQDADEIDGKHYLSPEACAGILKRAERRRKRLPADVAASLARVCGAKPVPPDLIRERPPSVAHTVISSVNRPDECKTIVVAGGDRPLHTLTEKKDTSDMDGNVVVASTLHASDGGVGLEHEIVPCLGTQPSYNRTGDVAGGVVNTVPAKVRFADGQDHVECSAGLPRRLTVLECERLQGFPDGYTALPGVADTPRHQQVGDSMAVPVVRWLGRRLLAQFGRPFRFASLCAGIEAASVAWCSGRWTESEWAGVWGPGLGCTAVLLAEIDPVRQALLRERWGAV